LIHRKFETLSIDNLRTLIGERELYIWGAGNQGRGLARVLQENDFSVEAFIDSSPNVIGVKLAGICVENPELILSGDTDRIFIIIAVFFYEKEISDICTKYGLLKGRDFIHYSLLKPRDYSIDVSGNCNLRCISCPRGSLNTKKPSFGIMSLDNFKKVIDKLKIEDPFVGNIQLYQWGEPTLNRELPEMITYAGVKGISCAVSSNLNNSVDYSRIIAARPEWFRVSASGWGEKYEITHTGAKWEVFLRNLKEVAALRKKFHPEMKIELYYHLYKHSTGEGFRKIRGLCEQLDIEFHPVYAYLISLDDVLKYLEGSPLPLTAQEAQERMLLDLEKGLAIARSESLLPCDAIRSVHINSDLSVSNCMMYYYPEENRAVANYLVSSINEIMMIRENCNLCRRCMRKGMHRYCGAYSTFKLDLKELAEDG